MLDSLGYEKNKNGVREELNLKLLVSSNPQEAELMKSMLEDVGVKLQIQTVDTATFTTAMSEGKYDMALTGHIGLSGDPDFLRLWFSGQASNAYAGNAVFDNKEFNNLASKQLSEDGEERKETIYSMQDILAEELPTLVIYHRPFYFVYDASVFDGWFNTHGGISDGIPLTDNKAAFVDYD
jgi:peptide/nickel transport system substrate-binding protein